MYAVIGADGFLGSAVIKEILENSDELVLAASLHEKFYGSDNRRVIPCIGDLTDRAYRLELVYRINSIKGTNVIYTAAVSNIDDVAMNPEKSNEINVEVLKKFSDSLYTYNKILFMSSDTVYGEGGKYRFRENDNLKPLSIYGEQKIKGEKIIETKGGTSLRLPLMFSQSFSPFKKHLCDSICLDLKNGKEVSLVTDSVRSTLDYGTVADIAVRLCGINKKLPPVINVAGDAALSKYELGLALCGKLGVSESLVVPIKSSENFLPGASRAVSALMDNSLLKSLINEEKIMMKL